MQGAQSLADLVAHFDLGKFSKGSARLDPKEMLALNGKILHDVPFAAVADRLAKLGLTGVDERFWLAVRGNIARLKDAAEWWGVVQGPLAPVIEDAAFAIAAGDLLPEGPWTEATWPAWTGAVKASTGRSGKALFHPLRLALTGREHGPEMKNLLPLIGRERARARLSGATA